jgi:hypothetical protein
MLNIPAFFVTSKNVGFLIILIIQDIESYGPIEK